MSLPRDSHSIPELLGDTVEQLGKLVQNEVALARAEISQKVALAGMGAAYFAGAAILVIPVIVMLLITLAIWLEARDFSPVTSHLLAALLGGVISVALALVGKSYLKAENLKPTVTAQQIERDIAAAKELAK